MGRLDSNKVSEDRRKMNIGVVGSRTWDDFERIRELIYSLPDDVTIVSGGAAGADSIAEYWARKRGLKTIIHLPDWSVGKSGGFQRNKLIVQDSDALYAFVRGESKGTRSTIKLAEKKGIPVHIINY